MNEYIFYTAEGYTYPPLEGYDVDNYQMLGRAFGNSADDAKSNLLRDNPWIEESGFDVDEIICKQLVTNEMKQDIQKVLQYILSDECGHFQENGELNCHILRLKEAIEN